ncbi:MAG: Hsp20/alpha crystallin family protein [Candidatus Nealsonbacteria bacterium]|nr:Hsp20/alpha crystallin family protein [Candidatus Nealsonbacteria bacterium]
MGFFDKLTGVGAEDQKPKKSASSAKEEKKGDKKKEKAVKKEETKAKAPKIESEREMDNGAEGQLTIDVYETENDFVIQSTIAGVKAEDLDIDIEDDMVTIRGERQRQAEEQKGKYYYQECYWGSFSRQVILPEEVDGSQAEASMKDGVLTLRIPKVKKTTKRKVAVKQKE